MSRNHHRLVAGVALGAALNAGAAGAALMIEGTVTPVAGGAFHYELTVDNDTLTDLSLITLDAPAGDPLIGGSLVPAPGFLASYDDLFGFLDLVEGVPPAGSFFAAGSVVSRFAFDSLAGIGDGFFTTVTAFGTLGQFVAGQVRLRPLQAASEPALPALVLLGLVPLLAASRRRARPHPTKETQR